ncbi:MAG TPA: M20/M25/M40 family metallo-hydrolase [Gemmatimonadaceae bacterium]|nr:M20/M25/M40 family metallo-hydrolase [Gemmatimonadaceae bacterium]
MPTTIATRAREAFADLAPEREELGALDEDLLRLQVTVAGIPAPTGAERLRAQWVARQLADAGLETRTDAAGNVIARIGGAIAQAPVVVCAHLDNVFPEGTELAFQQEGARITGPGICDNSRGLAVMLQIARSLRARERSLARPIEFVATTCEEGLGDLRGARQYLADCPRPFAVVAIDGAGDERIVNTGLGSRRFRAVFRGPGGHSWAAHGIPNPVHAAARAAAAIGDLRPAGAARVALSVNRIGGGLSINAIPEDAWFEVDVRTTDGRVLDPLEHQLRGILVGVTRSENENRAASGAALRVQFDRIGNRPGGETANDAPLVQAAIEATRLIGKSPELVTASTDANAAMSLGVPAIAIGGGGRGGDTHSRREWFDNTSATAGVERALTIVATMARMEG